MRESYDAVLFDLSGTLVDDTGSAIDGARDALLSIPDGRWGVVTSCGRRFARRLLTSAGLPHPFALIGAEDVKAGKPAPDCYLKAAEAFDLQPERCVVIEDSVPGATAARLAGMDVIEVGSSSRLRDLRFSIDDEGSISVNVARAAGRVTPLRQV